MFARVCTYCRHRVQLASVQKICLSRVRYHVAYTFVCMYLPDIHECLHMYTSSLSLSHTHTHTHQGVGDYYTDPQIHSLDGEGFGSGNMGPEGIRRFFKVCQGGKKSTLLGCLGALGVCMPLSACIHTHPYTHTHLPTYNLIHTHAHAHALFSCHTPINTPLRLTGSTSADIFALPATPLSDRQRIDIHSR